MMSTAQPALAQVRQPHPKIDWLGAVPFLVLHLVPLGIFFVTFHWSYLAVAVALYVARMFGITAGYHRYFAHRTYKTSRAFQFCLAFLAATAAQKGPLWWAAHHRHHHRHSDRPEDVHSPVQSGFWWSQVGWFLSFKNDGTDLRMVSDLAKYPELRWLNRFYYAPPALLGVVLFLLGGLPLLLWGCLSTVVLWHATFTINSLSHVFGSVRYPTTDHSKNNFFLALLTLGEGWHNNHHYYMNTANQGWFWWEVDVSYYVLRIFEVFGLVWDLRTPPAHIRDGRRGARELTVATVRSEPQ